MDIVDYKQKNFCNLVAKLAAFYALLMTYFISNISQISNISNKKQRVPSLILVPINFKKNFDIQKTGQKSIFTFLKKNNEHLFRIEINTHSPATPGAQKRLLKNSKLMFQAFVN